MRVINTVRPELVEACHELVEWGERQSAHGSTIRQAQGERLRLNQKLKYYTKLFFRS
jgi:hypothetical protein